MSSNEVKTSQKLDKWITREHMEAYKNDGAVCLRQVLSSHEIAILTKGIERNLASPSERMKIASSKDDPGCFIEDFCTWQTNPYYQQIIFNSVLSSIARRLMQSETVRFYHDHLLVKEPRTRQKTPWHQDQPYYNIDGHQSCSMWIPVDHVSRESTLEFIAGSHLGPWLMPRSFMDKEAKWFPEGSLSELPDIEANRAQFPILGWELAPGDIVCFHMLTLHAASGVPGTERRRVFSARYLGDDIRHAPRTWTTSPDFPGLLNELAAGAPMAHPLFPLIREEHVTTSD